MKCRRTFISISSKLLSFSGHYYSHTHTTVIHKPFDQLGSKSCWPETDSRDLMIRLDIFVPGKKIGD